MTTISQSHSPFGFLSHLSTLGRTIAASVVCCVVVAGGFWFANFRAKESLPVTQNSAILDRANDEVTFRLTTIFDGRTEQGERYSNSFYKTPDCQSLSKSVIFFNSVVAANSELRSEEGKASAVVERSVVTNREGRQVGERIALKFDNTEQRTSYAEVAWISDKVFHSIAATSLELALEFEQALNSQSGKISTQTDSARKITFTGAEIKHGKADGFNYTQQQFSSSDCEAVTVRTEFYPSPERAQEELSQRLKAVTTIIQRGARPNIQTLQTGRVVAMITAPPNSEQLEDTIVLWTNEGELHSIRGTMVHALEFERQYFK